MRKGIRSAIGFMIVLWAMSQFFSESFQALDDAATASLRAVEAAAISSQQQLQNQ